MPSDDHSTNVVQFESQEVREARELLSAIARAIAWSEFSEIDGDGSLDADISKVFDQLGDEDRCHCETLACDILQGLEAMGYCITKRDDA